MFVVLAAMLAAGGSGDQILGCTVPDRRGKPAIWSVKLDQPAGLVEVELGKPPTFYKATAIYRAQSVMFDILDASIVIDRASGTIERSLVEFGARTVVEGTCIAAQEVGRKAGSRAPGN